MNDGVQRVGAGLPPLRVLRHRDHRLGRLLPLLPPLPSSASSQHRSGLGVRAPALHQHLHSLSKEPGGGRPAHDAGASNRGGRQAARHAVGTESVGLSFRLCDFLLLHVHQYYSNGPDQPRPLPQDRPARWESARPERGLQRGGVLPGVGDVIRRDGATDDHSDQPGPQKYHRGVLSVAQESSRFGSSRGCDPVHGRRLLAHHRADRLLLRLHHGQSPPVLQELGEQQQRGKEQDQVPGLLDSAGVLRLLRAISGATHPSHDR